MHLEVIKIRVVIDEDVKKFLNKDNISLTINLKAWASWDCPVELKPSVLIGKPSDIFNYDLQIIDDIKIYITKKINSDCFIKLSVINFFGSQNLIATLR